MENKFDMKAPIGLYITSYEKSEDGNYNPILSHIFWGETIRQAFGYAKSHLISDVFFTGSFVGEMPWNNFVLYIDVDGKIMSLKDVKITQNIDNVLVKLSDISQDIHNKQEKSGLIQIVQKLSKDLSKKK